MIGLTGAHRTGKTRLAEAFSEETGGNIPFLRTSVSGVFAKMGLDPVTDHSFDVRLDVQEAILAHHANEYRSMNGRAFITDRTPVDFMAYTLADVGQHNLTPEQTVRLRKYLDKCVAVNNEIFTVLIIVQPGIAVTHEPGKGSVNPMYIEHVAQLVMGITASEDIQSSHFFIPRRMLSLQKRVECVSSAVQRTIERHERRIQQAEESGSPIVFH